jgi:hypothetical protein
MLEKEVYWLEDKDDKRSVKKVASWNCDVNDHR